ncbi:MAG: TonB-dependent receptor [Bacteroidetes bacterium]|nr:TonB-dependent receptor [Bacteroidota bacterium]
MSRRFSPLLTAFAIIIFINVLSADGVAQDRRLTGSVVRESGVPLRGAHVQVVGTRQGVISGEDGRFVLVVAEEAVTLRVTHLGYMPEERELAAGESAELRIVLREASVDVGAVTVTAMRREESLRDVSLPLSITDAAHLQRTAPVSVSDALDAEAGISLVRDGIWGTDVNIRGLGRANVVTLIDGARIETATNLAAGLSLIDIHDVERIEVIRGAASTLYGTGATGGVVNIVTGDGRFGDIPRINGTVNSSYSTVNDGAAASMGVEASDEAWFLRLRGSMRSAGDARTPTGVLRDSRFRDRSLAVHAGVRPYSSHEIRLRYQLFDARDVGIPGGASFPAQASARYPDELRRMLQFEYGVQEVTDALDRISLRLSNQRIDRNVEIIPNPAVILRPSAEHMMNAALLQTNWSFGAHQVIAGVDAWQRSYTGRRLREVQASNTIIAELPLPDARFQNIGLFVQDEWTVPGERLALTLGARADRIHVRNDAGYNLLYIERDGVRDDTPANRRLLWESRDTEEYSWSAHFGALYRLSPRLDVTLNLARSFRAPSLEERFQFIELGGATWLGDIALAAEKGSFIDLGLRVYDERVRVLANAFVNAMNDLVVDEQRNDSLYVKSNVGEALLYGGEVSMEYQAFRSVVLHARMAWVRGRDTGNDTDLPGIPPLNLRFGLRLPLAGYGTAELLFDAAADQHAVAPGEATTAGYALMHLHLRSEAFRVAGVSTIAYAGIDNIFDRAWRRHISTLRGLIIGEPGRNVFVRLQLLF